MPAASVQEIIDELTTGNLGSWTVEETTGPIPPEVLEMVHRLNRERNERAGYPPPPAEQDEPNRAMQSGQRRKKPTSALGRWWIARGEAGAVQVLGPFAEDVAKETQAAIGGKSKLYQAERKHQAEAEYLEFLRKVTMGRDSW